MGRRVNDAIVDIATNIMDTSKLTAPMQNIVDVLANYPQGASIGQIESGMLAQPIASH